MMEFTEREKAIFRDIFAAEVLPLREEIKQLKTLLVPHQPIFTDYEKGYKVAQEVTGLSLSTLKTYVKENRIPHTTIGGYKYFSRTELRGWLAKGEIV